ncbi:hypothetical protein Pla52n_00040 [Stieleria varia]|uniref:Uncharacterized protein n=1 Tax=Stieleria varia TaxID=2528005 RepID=A0A5C6B7I1_9BACT|nr:hypothetical protein Pla52n_00040 [Stieleria varia]
MLGLDSVGRYSTSLAKASHHVDQRKQNASRDRSLTQITKGASDIHSSKVPCPCNPCTSWSPGFSRSALHWALHSPSHPHLPPKNPGNPRGSVSRDVRSTIVARLSKSIAFSAVRCRLGESNDNPQAGTYSSQSLSETLTRRAKRAVPPCVFNKQAAPISRHAIENVRFSHLYSATRRHPTRRIYV